MIEIGLHDTARLILIMYYLAPMFKIIIDRRAAISPRGGLLRYVRLQREDEPPSGGALTKLWSAAYIWREKSNF